MQNHDFAASSVPVSLQNQRYNTRQCQEMRGLPKSEKPENENPSYFQSKKIAQKVVPQGPQIELHLLRGSGPISKTFLLFDLFDQEANHENPTLGASIVPQGPWNNANSFDLDDSSTMVGSRPLYNRTRP